MGQMYSDPCCFLKPISVLTTMIKKKAQYDYDLIVIGAGPAGTAAAKEAAQLGARTIIVDQSETSLEVPRWDLGGTCLNSGSIPMNIIYTTANLGIRILDAIHYGWMLPPLHHIFLRWKDMKQAVERHMTAIYHNTAVQLKGYKVEYLNSFVSFRNSHTLRLWQSGRSIYNELEFTGRFIIIAAGTEPTSIDIPGIHHCITTDQLFLLESCPGKALIVGNGVTAVECASFLSTLRLHVTVICLSILLDDIDVQMGDIVINSLHKRGVRIITDATLKAIQKVANGLLKVFWVNLRQTLDSETFNTVIIAVERRPAIKYLLLENAGVRVASDGYIRTTHERTNVSHIFAAGDIISARPKTCTVAAKAGKLLARSIFTTSTQQMEYEIVPMHMFTFPEYAWVGLTEDQAILKFGVKHLPVLLPSNRFYPVQCEQRPLLFKGDRT